MKIFGVLDTWIGMVLVSIGIFLWVVAAQKYKTRDVIILLGFDILIGFVMVFLIWRILGLDYVVKFFSNTIVIGSVMLISATHSLIFLAKRDRYYRSCKPSGQNLNSL